MFKTYVTLLSTTKIEDILEQADKVNNVPSRFSSVNNFIQLFGLLLLLCIILIAAYFVTKMFANIKLRQMADSNFKVIDTYQMTLNKTLQIIKIGSRYILISVNKDSISFLMELNENDIIIKEDDYENNQFRDIFEKIIKNQKIRKDKNK